MSAITGRYLAPNNGIRHWAIDWLHCSTRWSSPRYRLKEQLRYIRRAHGSREAKEFRNYLLWLGVYPVKPIHREDVSHEETDRQDR